MYVCIPIYIYVYRYMYVCAYICIYKYILTKQNMRLSENYFLPPGRPATFQTLLTSLSVSLADSSLSLHL